MNKCPVKLDMLCPETVNGLCEDLAPIVFRSISKHRMKPLTPHAKSLNVRRLNFTFTEAMVEFENVTLMEMTRFRAKDSSEELGV